MSLCLAIRVHTAVCAKALLLPLTHEDVHSVVGVQIYLRIKTLTSVIASVIGSGAVVSGSSLSERIDSLNAAASSLLSFSFIERAVGSIVASSDVDEIPVNCSSLKL